MEPRNPRDVDTFPRDRLPPPDQWPQLRFDLPEPRFPERLNCAAELLAHTTPDRPVFRTASGDTWTYGELRTRVDRVAHVLTGELGVMPGNRVLLRGPTTPWPAACRPAVLKAGAVAVTVLAQQRPHELTTMREIAPAGHALLRHPDVVETAVVGRPDASRGQVVVRARSSSLTRRRGRRRARCSGSGCARTSTRHARKAVPYERKVIPCPRKAIKRDGDDLE